MFSIFILDSLKLVLYFIVCASAALATRKLLTIPEEVHRKILHFIMVGSIFVFLYSFSSWQNAALAAAVFAIVIYPVLSIAERFDGYSKLLAERDSGEIKRSLILAFGMFAAVVSVCWGLLGAKYLALAVILGWGLGDATAALVGKKYGKHHLTGRFIDGKKSLEGTAAMFVVAFLAITSVLYLNNILPGYGCLTISTISAAVCAVVELHTKNGLDTLTCPAATLVVMVLLVHVWVGLL